MFGVVVVIKVGVLGSVGGGDVIVCRVLINRGCDFWRGILEDRVYGSSRGVGY